MTAVTDAIAVMDILRGKTSTNAELLRVADKFILYAGSAFQPVDPENPTNEEKAQLFLTIMKQQARSIIQKQAATTQLAENNTALQSAITTALNDF